MRNLGRPFNLPSVESLLIEIYRIVDPIEDASPTGTPYSGDELLFVTPLAPVGAPLDIQWFLNGSPIAGATGPTLDLASLALPLGLHDVRVEVTDNTSWVRDEAARSQWMSDARDYLVNVSLVQSYCSTAPNSLGGGAFISTQGSTSVGANDLTLVAQSASPGQFGVFYYGSAQIEVPFGDGYRCVGGSTFRFAPVPTSSPFGDASWQLDLNAPPEPAGQILAGSIWNFQFWYRDPAFGGAGFNLSNGLSATFIP